MKNLIRLIIPVLVSLLLAAPAFAHAVVSPNQVGTAAFQTFTLGIPAEKDNPTTSVRLVLPDGLKEVTPNVKPGWKIDEKKNGDDVTEITWSGGQILAGQRDDFVFSAQAPDKATTLDWKTYQTYSDGSVVSWDQAPGSKPAAGQDEATPYSQTKVVNDLQAAPTSDRTPLYLAIAAVVIAILALLRPMPKAKS